MEHKLPLSVAIITKNEEKKLPDCLKSVPLAAQVVIIDSGSTDGTLEIARRFGCEVYVEPWRGFGPQKQLAVDRCRQDWVLILDADERVTPEAYEEIARIVRLPRHEAAPGYSFPRRNIFWGRWIKSMGWWPDRVTRLFQRSEGRLTAAKVHEAVEVNGPVVALRTPLLHITEPDLSRIIQKIDQYSTTGAQEAFLAGKKSSYAYAFIRFLVTFLHNYILRRGFLDGGPGLVLAMLDSINKFFKYAKLAFLIKAKSQKLPLGTKGPPGPDKQ
jgi:glycosyltransferase involved in cell wall biosynthesis